jgi:hypothetical protein
MELPGLLYCSARMFVKIAAAAITVGTLPKWACTAACLLACLLACLQLGYRVAAILIIT